MFIYDDDNETAVNTDRIRALYIERIGHGQAITKADHDRMDSFRLKAFMGGRVSVIITEVTGLENRPKLVDRMHQITDCMQ